MLKSGSPYSNISLKQETEFLSFFPFYRLVGEGNKKSNFTHGNRSFTWAFQPHVEKANKWLQEKTQRRNEIKVTGSTTKQKYNQIVCLGEENVVLKGIFTPLKKIKKSTENVKESK
jgi:hypothetical protein